MLRYLHLDVFTDRAFEGNQLAVFPDPRGLDAGGMQAITREMNFSECTFVFPARSGGDVRMRIFTPAEELPMAGHPTIGSAFALAAEGTIAQGRTQVVFELGVGPTPVELEWQGERLAFAWMTQPLPAFGAIVHDRGTLSAALGLDPVDLVEGLPAQAVSCGVPFLLVPVATRRALDQAAVDRRALVRCCQAAGLPELPVFFFTADRAGDETVYSRMLGPGFGIGEDPATGSASGPLGCYLLRYGLADADAARAIVSLQGVAMKRPSRVHVSIDSRAGEITRVRVGGQSVLVGEGTLRSA
jgi:trans-2,3-dihydro-3-hydroxyanthranilate isomerase